MVEKTAYRGQQAARLGVVMQLYVQQSLGNLVQYLSSDDFSKDNAIQSVKDIFAMSTKCLDQLGRTAAFHHIVRRTVAMTDTGIYELADSSDFANLPLSGEGVFGTGLQPLLKARKDKKKQLDEMLPELKKRGSKRKYSPDRASQSEAKRQHYSTSTSTTNKNSSGWNNFRIPRVPREQRDQSFRTSAKYDKSGFKQESFPKRSSRGRMGKPASQ
ncbi:uncharacterized protein LOC123526570 [Mercenaria mercenaria]|uniref:uncharacterized protein LOC123526570 n=1 Tax=Mercenaria mercenaria TaxID=6596 RepID=UPI00234EDE94|nr:uncharacterized protein LOC123526570 [Mercenaria mercenaria]